MKNGQWIRIMTCVGAVVGAGFASGREIVSFFTQYGAASWGMILLSAGLMTGLCWLTLERSAQKGGAPWHALFTGAPARLCSLLLMVVTAGAMISASGQLAALLWPHEWAYSIGAVGTLVAAWKTGSLKRLGLLSSLSTAALMLALVGCLLFLPAEQGAALTNSAGNGWLRAAAYAGMNMTLAVGVICGCTQTSRRQNAGMVLGFGAAMLLLLCSANALYLRQPLLQDAALPIVGLLCRLGRGGFFGSTLLLYLAVFTTLASVLFALRAAMRSGLIAFALPLMLSCLGFEGIVGRVYAPVGLICLLAVFAPLLCGKLRQRKA